MVTLWGFEAVVLKAVLVYRKGHILGLIAFHTDSTLAQSSSAPTGQLLWHTNLPRHTDFTGINARNHTLSLS